VLRLSPAATTLISRGDSQRQLFSQPPLLLFRRRRRFVFAAFSAAIEYHFRRHFIFADFTAEAAIDYQD
jgi:hypothetical protein